MKHFTNSDWLKVCPYHVGITDTQEADRAIDWCLETLEPREWHMIEKQILPVLNFQDPMGPPLIFSFSNKKIMLPYSSLCIGNLNIDLLRDGNLSMRYEYRNRLGFESLF